MPHIKNCQVAVGSTKMNYLVFGTGKKPLVLLPGLGEALQGKMGGGLPIAWMYRKFAKDYRVYLFRRKNQMPKGYSIGEMAEDQGEAMHRLGISNAYVMGISQGSMIAMHLAATHPELVKKLVLANTTARCTPELEKCLRHWVQLLKEDNFKGLLDDMGEKIYTPKKLKQYKPWYPVLAVVGKPKSYRRFFVEASACLHVDEREQGKKIQCPTLVMGGDLDKVMGPTAAKEVADGIPGSRFLLSKGYGHSAYEEDPGFQKRLMEFFPG